MKALAILALLLTSCASTTVRDGAGHVILHTQANAASLSFNSGGTSLTIIGLDHSGATLAGGTAFAQGTNAIGGAVVGATLAAGSSGLFGPAVSTTKSLILPVSAASAPLVTKPSVPKATPAPSKDPNKIWPVTNP